MYLHKKACKFILLLAVVPFSGFNVADLVMPVQFLAVWVVWSRSLPLPAVSTPAPSRLTALPAKQEKQMGVLGLPVLWPSIPQLPYELKYWMQPFVLRSTGIGILLFVPDGFTINFSLFLQSLELFLTCLWGVKVVKLTRTRPQGWNIFNCGLPLVLTTVPERWSVQHN